MLLCIAMVFGLFPETAFATEIQQDIQAEEIIEAECLGNWTQSYLPLCDIDIK